MYTNIPIDETLKIIEEQLSLLNNNEHESKEIILLLNNTLKQNYFQFNNNYYLQTDGLPMGSPLSSLISEIFLQHIENQFIEEIKTQFNILFYGRFVDDIIVIYDDSLTQSNHILDKFNSIHPKLQYTMEKEINSSINFLDLTLKRYNKYIEYSIYRKPTTSKLSIDNFSIHPKSYKYANYHFLLNRLNQIPLNNANYRTEFNNIIQIAKYNNFPINKIYHLNHIIKNKITRKKITTLQNIDDKSKYYSKMTYYGTISDKIKSIFKKNNVNISFNIHNRNQLLLKNTIHERKIENESGIYKLNCKCGASYIGQTSRQFKKRISEHKRAYKYNMPDRSNYAAHLLHTDHIAIPFNNQYQIVKIVRDKRKLLTWEQLEIHKHNLFIDLINDQLPNSNNPLFELPKLHKTLYNNIFSNNNTVQISPQP